MTRILLLGGTGDARRLASRLLEAGHKPLASLAGATETPAAYPCPVRTGGFGGAEGLVAWLRRERPDAVIDATHPFASQMSANARAAAAATGTRLLRMARPEWTRREGETWIETPDLAAAAEALPAGARAFLATGRGSLTYFADRQDLWLALRVVDPPDEAFPGDGEYIVARPPFDVASERALLVRLKIDHLVVKNAGGAAGRTKLDAARALGIPIVVVARPPGANDDTVTADEILAALE